MNGYGTRAQQYWTEHRPQEVAQMTDPTAFFSTLGEEIQERVLSLSDALAGSDQVGETYLEKVGRLNAARLQAEEVALDELVYSQTPQDEDDEQEPSEVDQMLSRTWQQVHDELEQ
ncbi:TnpV protein [Luteimicrobium sp. DT211]|uniref:TnpV protein n=1 Tax=Luteimicrobium sp. DT211 TaxID=3393412 RepID=UPI003CEB5145